MATTYATEPTDTIPSPDARVQSWGDQGPLRQGPWESETSAHSGGKSARKSLPDATGQRERKIVIPRFWTQLSMKALGAAQEERRGWRAALEIRSDFLSTVVREALRSGLT